MGRSKKQRKNNTTKTVSLPTNINTEDLQYIIAQAIKEANNCKEEDDPKKLPRITSKQLISIFFGKLKNFSSHNGTIALVQVFILPICILIKWCGYILATILLVGAIVTAICEPSLTQIWATSFIILFAIILWLVARLFGIASIEIEKSKKPDVVYGFASFLLAIIAIAISLIDLA